MLFEDFFLTLRFLTVFFLEANAIVQVSLSLIPTPTYPKNNHAQQSTYTWRAGITINVGTRFFAIISS